MSSFWRLGLVDVVTFSESLNLFLFNRLIFQKLLTNRELGSKTVPKPKDVAFHGAKMVVGSNSLTTSLVKYSVNVCDMYRFFKGEKNDCKMGGALSDLILKLLFIKTPHAPA